MKIKTQFRLFIACIIAAPLIFAAALITREQFRAPERMLMNGIRQGSSKPISKRDLKTLKDAIRNYPPEVEMLVIADHSELLVSTIEEFKGKRTIDTPSLFFFIRQTSDRYFYQIDSPHLVDSSAEIIIITRMERDRERRRKPPHHNLLGTLAVFAALFELTCIFFIIYVSMTISRSITMLEKNTERIAAGELDKPLEKPRDLRTTNEITNLADNLEKMRVALKEETERRTRFIMGISHDLRTPVAVIKGYTEAMNDGMMTEAEEQKKALEIIGGKTSQLETMINTLINFVKLDSTSWREKLKKQPIRPDLETFAKSCKNTGDVFKRDVVTEVSVSEETEVSFDSQLFQRALENIFSNAIRYTKDGDRITFCAKETENEISITIADTGIGINEGEVAHIFDLFYRATNSRREEGMGIGLSVVKNIIDTHGWNISVDSKKGEGTAFTIVIPKTV